MVVSGFSSHDMRLKVRSTSHHDALIPIVGINIRLRSCYFQLLDIDAQVCISFISTPCTHPMLIFLIQYTSVIWNITKQDKAETCYQTGLMGKIRSRMAMLGRLW